MSLGLILPPHKLSKSRPYNPAQECLQEQQHLEHLRQEHRFLVFDSMTKPLWTFTPG